jgi:hypothetical protein
MLDWTGSLTGLEHMVAAMVASQYSTALSSAQVNGGVSVDDEDLLD